MNVLVDSPAGKDGQAAQSAQATLLARMGRLVPAWRANAAALDAARAFPTAELDDLRAIGALAAPALGRHGGLGLGTEPEQAACLLDLLRLIGGANLSVGRLFEGHVNALKLVALYGTEAQTGRAARDAAAGHLFAIWNTEPACGLVLGDGLLRGRKIVCSAAGHATRAVVTARHAGQDQMLLLELAPGEHVGEKTFPLQGMRACGTGSMVFDGMAVPPSALIGGPGDYLRQPAFSAGAWRTSAVTLGGLEALVSEARGQLVARGRADHPHQRARMGEALIAQQTALLWMRHTARVAEGAMGIAQADPGDVCGYVNLARMAVETASLDAMRLVQRSLGLAALQQANPVERMLRDLATYLRQPAPDESLDEAAAWFMTRAMPS